MTLDLDGGAGSVMASVTATDGHPFWVPELGQWLPASDLRVGQLLQTAAGTYVQISALDRWTEPQRVHNLTINDIHTYYVLAGPSPVLVHNCGIALGMSEVDGNPLALQEFADKVNAKSYHDWPSQGDNWVSELKGYAKDGKTRIHFSLDGIDDPVAFAGRGKGVDPIFDGHATAWELNLVTSSKSAMSRTTFYRHGREVASPFE